MLSLRPLRALAVLWVPLVSTACIESVGPARETTGFISATTFETGRGEFVLRFQGAFYKYDGLNPGIPAAETCEGRPFSTLPPSVATFPTVLAGDQLFTEIAGREDTLYQTAGIGITVYQLLTVNAVPFTPGDTLTVDVPGAVDGFPATTLRVRTSDDFTFDPVGNPTPGQPLRLTWTPAPTPGSLMIFSLRFSDGSSEVPTTQLYCVFNDDGIGDVPADLSAIWGASNPEIRQVVATRVRFTEQVLDARRKVFLLSYFQKPSLTLPSQ